MLAILGTESAEPTLTFFHCEDRTCARMVASEHFAGRSWKRMALAPDNTSVALGDAGGTVRLVDGVSGRLRWTHQGHGGYVLCVTFSPDGSRIVSAGADRTLKIWDTLSGNELMAWQDAEGVPCEIVFTAASVIGVGVADLRTSHMAVWSTTDFSTSVGETLRRASEPADLVDQLLKEQVLCQDVLDHLRTDPGLGEELRARALRLARERRDDPQKLNRSAWEVVKLPTQGDERYRQALRWAEAASGRKPDDGMIQNTLGVAQYRAGRYADAVDALRRSRTLNSGLTPSALAVPSDTIFLAMALYQLGRADEARAELDRLWPIRGPMKFLTDDETRGFLAEAEALILGTPPSASTQPKTDDVDSGTDATDNGRGAE
jgi:hypothetical protein